MSRARIGNGETERIRVLLTSNGSPVTGATVLLKVTRDSDGFNLDFSDLTFKAATASTVTMTALDAVNSSGEYYYDFDTSSITNVVLDDTYSTTVNSVSGNNVPRFGEIKTDGRLNSQPPRIRKNTALANFMVFMKDVNGEGVTGLTISAQRNLDAAGFSAMTNDPPTEIANGWYKIDFSQADTNGDVVAYEFTGTGARPVAFTIAMQQSA